MNIGSATSIAAMAIANNQTGVGAQVLAKTLHPHQGAGQGATQGAPLQAEPGNTAVFASKGQHINIKA